MEKLRCHCLKVRIRILVVLLVAGAWPSGTVVAREAGMQELLNQRITIQARQQSVSVVLAELERLSSVRFLYSIDLIGADRKVTVSAKNEPLHRVLEKLLKPLRLHYEVSNRLIVISPVQSLRPPAGREKDTEQKLPEQKVSGTVRDEKGNGLPGVNVVIKNTRQGLITDADGHFTTTVSGPEAVLVFSFVGYASQEIVVGNRNTLEVVLKTDEKSLEEVVVVGYGTQSKRNLTSSVSSVSGSELAAQPVQQAGQALQGKVAGVQIVQNSGSPGSSLLIRVRGAGTVTNSDPLYVIDGNLGASLSSVDPNQIESIEVLKSASAAAIYGAQGANGVIIVTTKKGKAGSGGIRLNAYYGIQQVHRKMPVANARQYAELYNMALTNAGREPLFKDVASLGEGTDWQDAIFRVSPIANVELSANGGSDRGNYYISGAYFNQKGIVIGTDYSRISFRINSEYKVTPSVTVGENVMLSYGVRNTIPEFGARNPVPNAWHMDPTVPVKNPDGTWGYPKFSDTKNPVAEATLNHNTIRTPLLNGSLYAKVVLLEGLLFRSQLNTNVGFSNTYNFIPTFDIFPLQRNLVTSLSREVVQTVNWDWQNTLTYDKIIGNHELEVLAGVTALSNKVESLVASGQNLPANSNFDPNLRYLNLATTGQRAAGGAGDYGMLSLLGRINYNYKGKYLATANFRVDGSSRFGKNNRFGAFPSFSAGWRISDEEFMKGASFIDDLKLRGGWGMLGNQNSLPNYAFASTVTPGIYYAFGNGIAQGQAATTYGNPDLKWESTNETEIGIDFAGFGNRVTFSAAYYHKKTSNMLLRVPIPAYTGVTTAPFVNGGNISNKGVEIALGYRSRPDAKVTYELAVNVSGNKNRVTRLSNTQAAIFAGSFSRAAVGYPLGSFYGHVMDGLFQTQEEVTAHAFQNTGTAPGDIRFKDLNKDGVINQDDRTLIGNPWPKMSYGMNAGLRWKNLDLSLVFQGTLGNDIIANWKYFTQGSNFYNYDLEMLHAWNGPGTSNSIPRLNVNDPNNNLRPSSFYVEDGSYFRLKSLQIGYTFKTGDTPGAKKLNVYASCQNLLTVTGYKGFDPEIGSPDSPLILGVDEGYYPQPRIFTLGVNLGL